jgi:signal transduction histidine kinase
VDRDRVLQVLSNLMGNAIKFTPEGGSITIGFQARAEDVFFWVRDTGPGIAPEDLPRIFARFWQSKDSSRLGMGLGLSIAKAIVELHGGTIWAESCLGEGALFQFTLPKLGGEEGSAPLH